MTDYIGNAIIGFFSGFGGGLAALAIKLWIEPILTKAHKETIRAVKPKHKRKVI